MSSLPASSPVPSTLFRTSEVAAILKVSEPTLSRWRTNNIGPRWLNLNGLPRYRAEDINAWMKERLQ